MRDAPSLTAVAGQIEESLLTAEQTMAELALLDDDLARSEARWLEKMAQALRMALVAGVDTVVLTRLHLRLETALRRAAMFLAEPDAPPPSQRPTFRPPHPQHRDDSPSQRPTVRPPPPRTTSDVVPRASVPEV